MFTISFPVRLATEEAADPTLCFYLSGPVDSWEGFMVGKLGWNGEPPAPCVPADDPTAAVLHWLAAELREPPAFSVARNQGGS